MDFPAQTRLLFAHGPVNDIQQSEVVNWLAEVRGGAALDCGQSGLFGVVCCNKDDGDANSALIQGLLQLKAVHPWHSDIHDGAGIVVNNLAAQKIERVLKRLNLQSGGLQESRHRATDGSIVIEYIHKHDERKVARQ